MCIVLLKVLDLQVPAGVYCSGFGGSPAFSQLSPGPGHLGRNLTWDTKNWSEAHYFPEGQRLNSDTIDDLRA